MSVTTALDIITAALKKANVLGVGQTASAEDSIDALDLLNLLLEQWSLESLLVYHRTDVFLTSTGAQSYTVGPGGQFACPRPERIESAFARQFGVNLPADYPLQVIQTQEQYNQIFLKTLPSFPSYCFYDGAYPLGNLFVWPVISNQFEIHISVLDQLQQFNDLSDSVSLPIGYKYALIYNLAAELYSSYGLPGDPKVEQLAAASKLKIKRLNDRTPSLTMPGALQSPTQYNIYGDVVR